MNQAASSEEIKAVSNDRSHARREDANEYESDDTIFDSLLTTIRHNPVASLAVGAALFALTRTPAGKVIRPAISLAISSGAASALATAAIKQFSRK